MNPVAVFTMVIAALNRGDYHAAASSFDPVSLARFRTRHVESYQSSEASPGMTADDILRSNPEMPREVAEYYAARSRQLRDPNDTLQSDFSGIDNVEQLEQLSAPELFAAWLRARSMRDKIMRSSAGGGLPVENADIILAELADDFAYKALGVRVGRRYGRAHHLPRREIFGF